MEVLFLQVLTLSLTCGAVALPLLLLSRRLSSRYAAKTMYFLWLAVGLRLALPVRFHLPTAPITVRVPTYPVYAPGAATLAPAGAQAPAPLVGVMAPASQGLDWVTLLAGLWLVGVAVFFLWHVTAYGLARYRLLKNAKPLGGKVYSSPLVQSPMAMGLLQPVVFVPQAGAEELALRHEFCHIRRGDLWYKALFLAVNALHWFNPLVWWMAGEAGRNLELCCDDDVLSAADAGERRE